MTTKICTRCVSDTTIKKNQDLIWDATDDPDADDPGIVDYSNWKTSKVSGTGPINN